MLSPSVYIGRESVAQHSLFSDVRRCMLHGVFAMRECVSLAYYSSVYAQPIILGHIFVLVPFLHIIRNHHIISIDTNEKQPYKYVSRALDSFFFFGCNGWLEKEKRVFSQKDDFHIIIHGPIHTAYTQSEIHIYYFGVFIRYCWCRWHFFFSFVETFFVHSFALFSCCSVVVLYLYLPWTLYFFFFLYIHSHLWVFFHHWKT